jgi:hypothetical protein
MSRFGITMGVIVTVLAVIAAGIYFAGYADDVARWGAKKYYVGKAKAEVEALGKVGGEAAQGFLKGELFEHLCLFCLYLPLVYSSVGMEMAVIGVW